MLDGLPVDLIPYVFPAVYLGVLGLLHVLVIVRPGETQLRQQWALFDERHSSGDDQDLPIPARRLPWPRQADILAGWRALHARELGAVAKLAPEELRAQLRVRAAELPADEAGQLLRAAARDAARDLDPKPAPRGGAASSQRVLRRRRSSAADPDHAERSARATLKEILSTVYDTRDTAYEEAAEVYRKTIWLALVGLLAIAALGAAFDEGHAYFLAGAVGGLMSRMTRILSRRPRANDYGASWSTLILAPVTGGLAGWLGVLLTDALASGGFGVLDEATFRNLFSDSTTLGDADATLALAVAFVFGFSERLINRAATAAEERVVPKLPTTETRPAS
jgi:hypothetical protein